MIALSQTELHSVLEAYALANTPEFLYRKLRPLPAVQRLADESSARELGSYYRKIGRKKHGRELKEVAIAYAALAALTIMEPPPAERTFKSLEKVDLDWGPDMIQRFLNIPTVHTSAKFTIPPLRLSRPRMLSSQS